jgi:hypothetical protein
MKYTTRKTRRRWEDNIKMDLRTLEWGDIKCMKIRNSGGFYKMLGHSRVAEQLAASQDEPASMELVSWLVSPKI